jgi:two-component system sensor histidine kinase UhpB
MGAGPLALWGVRLQRFLGVDPIWPILRGVIRRTNLLTQVLVVNLLLVGAAGIGAVLASNPKYEIGDTPRTALVVAIAVALTVVFNVYLLQRRFQPLEQLVEEMERADLSRPGANLRPDAEMHGPEEVARLHNAFRLMVERLDAERRRTSSAALAAQEEERARVARDLHDEVNQSLTGLLLRLEALRSNAPPELARDLDETKSLANQAMQELLRLARQLRPTALDDLGLKAAVAGLVEDLDKREGLRASLGTDGSLSDLPADVQLVIYRVAQEALSNVAQHSAAETVDVVITRRDDYAALTVVDDGVGFSFDEGGTGLGLGGMRERALLVDGHVEFQSRPDSGTRIELVVPIGLRGHA